MPPRLHSDGTVWESPAPTRRSFPNNRSQYLTNQPKENTLDQRGIPHHLPILGQQDRFSWKHYYPRSSRKAEEFPQTGNFTLNGSGHPPSTPSYRKKARFSKNLEEESWTTLTPSPALEDDTGNTISRRRQRNSGFSRVAAWSLDALLSFSLASASVTSSSALYITNIGGTAQRSARPHQRPK